MRTIFAALLILASTLAVLASCANMTTAERNRERQQIQRQLDAGAITQEDADEQMSQLDADDGDALLWTGILGNLALQAAGVFAQRRSTSKLRSDLAETDATILRMLTREHWNEDEQETRS